MTAKPVVPEISPDLTIEQRIELRLDLMRRVKLLDDLLRTAQAKRCATDSFVCPAAEVN
jgi:hypothetical protein